MSPSRPDHEAVDDDLRRLARRLGAQGFARSQESVDRAADDEVRDELRLDRGNGRIQGRIDQRREDGESHRVELALTPFRDASHTVTSYAAVSRDVTHLREMEADLELEAGIRTALAAAVQSLVPDATFQETAQVICERLTTLAWVDIAAVGAFVADDRAVLVASNGPARFVMQPGDPLPAHRARRVLERFAKGPWAEYWEATPEDGTWGKRMDAAGIRAFGFGPVVHGDHVDGVVVIGTRHRDFARTLVDKMAAVIDFSTTTSALLADRLHTRRLQTESARTIETTIADRAFKIVYQPIVTLGSREVVGHEALTRFPSGIRPDLCFAEASDVGLGVELELVTLEAALLGTRGLPAGPWLDLNVSPRLLRDPERLRALLGAADREIVLEITEHELVSDYAALRASVRSLGAGIRLAVDDAGAGVADFGHIIELGADFVKLDTSLVRLVDSDLGRQAMVVGMRHFAGTAGCRLIAEGVETEEEARTLRELGVEFGQGYLYGRPEASPMVGAVKPARAATRPRRAGTVPVGRP